MSEAERLQKIIAAAGLASRREAERWIDAGEVLLNGHVASVGDKADPSRDEITVRGIKLAAAQRKLYYALNKPRGFVTTMKDPQGRPTIARFTRSVKERLFPVGRLDMNSEGLLLLTNDGELSQLLQHPRHKVAKTYLVKVGGRLSRAAQKQLAAGVVLDDGPTAPAQVENVRFSNKNTWFELTIHEGRNRQVRRMCQAVGYQVSALKRIRIGNIALGDLAVGEMRQLTVAELLRLRDICHH